MFEGRGKMTITGVGQEKEYAKLNIDELTR
ncbi:hypothetical protein ABID99_000952 [Mucilaginibacter sp. OAE612]